MLGSSMECPGCRPRNSRGWTQECTHARLEVVQLEGPLTPVILALPGALALPAHGTSVAAAPASLPACYCISGTDKQRQHVLHAPWRRSYAVGS